jgi:putative FmdB family regulatory protein
MPVYEYYCEPCDGIFEALRPMRDASAPAGCPVCARDGQRIMPTSFAAFTFREGYPRRLPDKGTYWHLGKEVKSRIKGGMRPWEHQELNKPRPKPRPLKGDIAIAREKEHARNKERAKIRASGIRGNVDSRLPPKLRPPMKRPGT